MRLAIISQCTGSKARTTPLHLKAHEFLDANHLARRERELSEFRLPAERMYTGDQHIDVVRGLQRLRGAGLHPDLWIVSAGYGVIKGEEEIVPYEATFRQMGGQAIRARGSQLGIPAGIRRIIADYPLTLVLLGKDYLAAADPPLPGPTAGRVVGFTSQPGDKYWRGNVTTLRLTSDMCTQFGASQIRLKGALFARMTDTVADDPDLWLEALVSDRTDVTVRRALGLLET